MGSIYEPVSIYLASINDWGAEPDIFSLARCADIHFPPMATSMLWPPLCHSLTNDMRQTVARNSAGRVDWLRVLFLCVDRSA